jgi:hypothetical protein
VPDLRAEPREESVPILDMLDDYLLKEGWTIRNPENPTEEANYGDSVYIAARGRFKGKARGWVDAIGDQADIECGFEPVPPR